MLSTDQSTETSLKRSREDEPASADPKEAPAESNPESNQPSKEAESEPSGQKRQKTSAADTKRGRNLFGLIRGTLNKLKETNTQKSEAAIRREQLEQRLQEKLKQENEAIAEEVKKENELRRAKLEKQRQEEDERRQALAKDITNTQSQNLAHFLKTDTKPAMYFLPGKHNDKTLGLLNSNLEKATKSKSDEAPQDDKNVNDRNETVAVAADQKPE
ncbi:hypothetical protein HDV05_005456 [Chytridiales sp. JEL 0842]|nr:hypothetical protein HDV05_005456 [Chytridiales sp. JEL 0842]